jgi:hypothetical protein
MLKRVGTILIAAASLAACSESIVPTEPAVPTGTTEAPIAGDQKAMVLLTCQVSVAAKSMSCAPAAPATVAGRSADLIFGGQDQYVRVTSTNVVTNGTISLSADVTVKNLSAQPWGTADGINPTAEGVRVFFHTGPTNNVTVANSSGTPENFTAPNQPFFQYSGGALGGDGILDPGETSSPLNWQFTLNNQATFTFQVLIKTAMPAEQGVLRWARSTAVSTPLYFNTVWGNAANDVWAGGTSGTISHWDGTAWSNVAFAAGATGDVKRLWGNAANNVWAAGGGGDLQHFDGATWTLIANEGVPLYGLWGSSTSDVWSVGQAGKVFHWNGSAWSSWPTGLSGTPDLSAVWGTGPTNVYAVGGTSVWNYDGSNGQNWRVIDVNAGNPNGENLRTIWGSSPADIWVAGANGFLMHGVNGTWAQEANLGTGTILSLWGFADNDVYAVSNLGDIFHYNGASWVALPNANSVLNGVWGSSPRDVWAVGAISDYSINLALHGTR